MMVTIHHHTACNKRIDRIIVIKIIVQGEIVRSRSEYTDDNAYHDSKAMISVS